MKEGYLKRNSNLPLISQHNRSIHRHKLSLDVTLVNAPNTHITDISLPSQRYLNGTFTAKSKQHLPMNPFITPRNLSKSYKKYISGLSEKAKANYPISGNETIKTMNDSLSEFELRELTSVKEVFFIGDVKKKIHGSLHEVNWGYDDIDANYKIIIGEHLIFRYEILSVLGSGSFGQVCKCLDHKTSEICAVKILRNKNKFHKQGEVEISLLKALSSYEDCLNSIVKIQSNFTFRSHLCIVFELLHISLFDFLKRNYYRGLSMSVIKLLAQQLLFGLKCTKSLSIVHCDLKPENVLFVSANSPQVKLIDFGSGCFESHQMYTYIQSRFYRSPEVMLGFPYTPAIDMWSFGCIMVELYKGSPLFPGINEEDQMSRIMEVLGIPPKTIIHQSPRKLQFFDKFCMPLPVIDSKGCLRKIGSLPLKKIISDNENFLNFVDMCLAWTPEERLTPEQGLEHLWLKT